MVKSLAQYRTLKGWEVPIEASNFSPSGDNRWSNRDMDPVPPEGRNWNTMNYVFYWLSDVYGTSGLALAGSMITLGLKWWQAVLAIWAGYQLISIFCVLNGTVGARLHTSFAVTVRSSFGFWLSYVPVIFRLAVATVWYGVNTYNGGLALYACLRAIWPSLTNLPNTIPTSASVTSRNMVCFFVFFVLQTALQMVPVSRLRWLFAAKAIVGPAAGFAMLGYYVHKSNGALYAGSGLVGTKLAWTWLSCFNSSVGSYSTLAVNISDFTRYARRPKDQYIQAVVLPACCATTAIMGVFIASGAQNIYGGAIQFNPLNTLDHWTNRPALFFVGAAFSYCQLCTNISSNGLSAANDWCVLFPRYLNIRRGGLLTSIIGCWCFVPWKALASATAYINLFGAYVIFLAPVAGIMIADYYLVKKGRVDVRALYDPQGRYRYWRGINWRALVTMVIAIIPSFPGFLNKVSSAVTVPTSIIHFYTLAFPYGICSSIIVFTLLSHIWKPTDSLIPAHLDAEAFACDAVLYGQEAPVEGQDGEEKCVGTESVTAASRG